MIKYKLEDGSVIDVTGYSQESIDFLLTQHPEAELIEEGAVEDFQNGAAEKDADVVPVATPSRASVISGVQPTDTGLELEDTSSELQEAKDPVEPLPTLESYIPEEAYSTTARGSTIINPLEQQNAKEKYNKYYNDLSKVNTDLSAVSLDNAVIQYESAYSDSEGFDFEKDGRGVTVTAPNGNKKSFITSQGGGRGGYKGQQWSSVQEFIERNKDAEAWTNKSKNVENLERVVFDLIENGDYYDLDGGDAPIKDTRDLQQNHPGLVKEIKNEALNRYNKYYRSEGEEGFFGDTALDVADLSDYRIDKIVDNAFSQSISKDLEEADLEILNIIKEEADKKFEGNENAMSDWATKGGASEITNPNKKAIANTWAKAYELRSNLTSKSLTPVQQVEYKKELERLTAEATALSKDYLSPDNVILFDPLKGAVNTLSKQEAAKQEATSNIDLTDTVNEERARLLALKNGSFQALKNRYTAHRIDLVDTRSRLQNEYTVERGDGSKYNATLGDIVTSYFGTGITEGTKVYGKKSDDLGTGTIQEVLGPKEIEGIAKDYLDLKARDVAFQDMYLLNIDPKSVERTGFFGSLGEGFLESLSSGETVDYFTGVNDSDMLAVEKQIGDEAGIEWDDAQKENFKETTSEFVGTTLGGLPVLAAEFAVANVVAGAAMAVAGVDVALGALKAGKYFKNAKYSEYGFSKTAMKYDDIVKAAAADGYKGNIMSKSVQKWVSKQPDIVKVGGGAVDKLKALAVDSAVEAFKMEGVMGEGGAAMGATFTPAAALTNTIASRLGIRFKAKGPFHKLNDLVLKPAKSGLVMVPSAEGGAIIEAAFDDFAGGEDFNTYMDKNFNDIEWLGEGGIYRRLLGHAVAGAGLSYSHLNPKNIFKTIKEQQKLRTQASVQIDFLYKEIAKNSQTPEGLKKIENDFKPKLEKAAEIYQTADNYISEAYALNEATDPQNNARIAQKDFTNAQKGHKKTTGKDMNAKFTVNMDGEGMQGKAAQVTKRDDGGFDIVVDARKYHKGIFNHELGHVYGEMFGINNPENLAKIVDYIEPLVKQNLGVDFKNLIEEVYEGKQVKELNSEEYLMGLIEIMGKEGSSLVQNNTFGQIAQKVKGLYERKMKGSFGNKPPQLKIESPTELLNLLQRLSQGVGKDGSVKQFQALQGLYIEGNKIFDGKTKEIKGSYGSGDVANQIANIMLEQRSIAATPAAERTPAQLEKLKTNVAKIKALKSQPSTKKAKKSDKEIDIFHGGEIKTVKDIDGSVYFSESKEQAEEYAKGNQGAVSKFKIKESEVASEAEVFEVIRELGIQPKIKDWSIDDSRLYELIDNRFENSFSKSDLSKLNNALSSKGIKASRFTDSDLRTGRDTENIVVFDKTMLETNIDSKLSQIKELENESKELAKKFNKDVIKSSKQTRLENEVLEELKEPIGKLVTSRTKALFDPIAVDARGGVTREKFQDSMRSDLTAMILNEYKPGTQPIEKFIINRGYLRANNLAERLGIKSVKEGIDKGIEAAEKVAAETMLSTEKEVNLIEPVNRLIRDPDLKDSFIKEVQEATKDLDPDQVNYKTLIDKAPELTKKVFGEVIKENGKVDKAKTKKLQQQFIRNNASALYKLLPEGARKFATGLKTATGVQAGLLKSFYEKGERADMTEGTAAGLNVQVKKPYNETDFLEVFGANKDQVQDRNQQTAIDALIKEIGKAMTNRTYRKALENSEVSMNTIQKIADGKSIDMASFDIATNIGKVFIEGKETESSNATYAQLISQVSRNLSKYFGPLSVEMKRSAEKRNVSLEQVVEERFMTEANWRKFYEQEGLDYTGLNEVGSADVAKNGKKRSENLAEGLKVLLEAYPNMESAPSWLRNSLMSTIGVNKRVKLEGKTINQKTAGVNNRPAMIESYFGKVKYNKNSKEAWDAKGGPYQYSYFVMPGKGKTSIKNIGGSGFNGKLEKKLVKLRDKYKNNTSNPNFRKEYIEFTRDLLTHPELKGQENGYELTVQANLNVLKKAYITLYDAVKSGKISKTTAADILRIQTNHSDGIFKILAPYESVTMGGIGKYKKGKAKNTHNEHMIELMNYNLDFMNIIKKAKSREDAIDAINDLTEGLGQSVIDVPTQRVKDSKRFGGPSKQMYADKVLNTFLRTGSLNNNVIITGDYKGSTQAEALFKKLGPEKLQEVFNKVPEYRRKIQWNRMNDALSEIKKQKILASENIAADFNKIVSKVTGIKEDISDIAAKQAAGSKGKYKLFVSASADDFVGLMNYNAGKGKEGDAHQKFFKENLYDPYADAYRGINSDNVQMSKQFKDIKNHIKTNSPSFNLRKKIEGSEFTFEQALRVAIWDSQGIEVPGINKADLKVLKEAVNKSVELSVLKLNLKRIAGGEYAMPGKNWYAGDISSDLRLGLNTTLRSKRLAQWKENVDNMFTPEIMNKLEAAHGTPYRKALEGMLDAMYTGKTRRTSESSLEGRTLNYLNNSVGTIMFLNQRSATLQMLSATNYINWSDNNPIKAGAALANVPQFAKDFKTLFNSDWAKSRREGLRINVTESEIADAVTGSENTPKSIVSLLLKKGFLPTQIADATATALGGASLYRNRIKTYEKQGFEAKEAENKAMQDWIEISETNQQSSRPDKVSMQQRSDLGKLVLAFANTPMQYTRETKKAILDLKNNRGDKKTNLSKIAYYTFVQSAIFSSLQSAIFKMAWSDDEEDKKFLENKAPKIINSMADGFFRGMGYGGGIVTMLKNVGLEIKKQSDYGYKGKMENAAWKLLDISPPISSKVSKIRYAFKNIDRAGGFEKAKELPLSLDNPLVKSTAGMTEAVANVPTARLLNKVQSLAEVASSQRKWYEKLALLSGWKSWELDPEKTYKEKKKKTTSKGRKIYERKTYEIKTYK